MDKRTKVLTEAMHAEKNINVHNRMVTVRGVLIGHSTQNMADLMDVDVRTVQLWMKRFNSKGVDGLRDSTGRGRKPDTSYNRPYAY